MTSCAFVPSKIKVTQSGFIVLTFQFPLTLERCVGRCSLYSTTFTSDVVTTIHINRIYICVWRHHMHVRQTIFEFYCRFQEWNKNDMYIYYSHIIQSSSKCLMWGFVMGKKGNVIWWLRQNDFKRNLHCSM